MLLDHDLKLCLLVDPINLMVDMYFWKNFYYIFSMSSRTMESLSTSRAWETSVYCK
jgi:hypothetical protein